MYNNTQNSLCQYTYKYICMPFSSVLCWNADFLLFCLFTVTATKIIMLEVSIPRENNYFRHSQRCVYMRWKHLSQKNQTYKAKPRTIYTRSKLFFCTNGWMWDFFDLSARMASETLKHRILLIKWVISVRHINRLKTASFYQDPVHSGRCQSGDVLGAIW